MVLEQLDTQMKEKKKTKKLTRGTNINLKFIIPLNRGHENITLLEKK